jgi:hypothetical protein
MKKLFLCHYNGDAGEINLLAEELMLRGIVPWIDKCGGYYLGDSSPEAARRAIRDDCFGLLFYATPQAFERPFITNVELPEAICAMEQNPCFIIAAVPRGMNFNELSTKSVKTVGIDLGKFHTQQINTEDGTEQSSLINQFRNLAVLILRQQLDTQSRKCPKEIFSFQFSTRELLPSDEDDILCINTTLHGGKGIRSDSQPNWDRIVAGLHDVKTGIAEYFGRPRLRVHGSKHLTAAFLFGKVFSRPSGFRIDIRQGDDFWSSDYPDDGSAPLIVRETDGSVTSTSLFVEITTTGKSVSNIVRERIRQTGELPYRFLSFTPANSDSSGIFIDNRICVSMARQIRDNIARMIGRFSIKEIHIFSSIPQALAVMIGHNLNALPTIQLYEFDGMNYHPSYKVNTSL